MSNISTDEFFSLVNMINGEDEDLLIAIENIKNLKLDSLYINLLYKATWFTKRSMFKQSLSEEKIEISKSNDVFTFEELYDEIANQNNNNCKEIFEIMVSDHLSKLIKFPFIKNIKVNVK
jgi:hypothetical protein